MGYIRGIPQTMIPLQYRFFGGEMVPDLRGESSFLVWYLLDGVFVRGWFPSPRSRNRPMGNSQFG